MLIRLIKKFLKNESGLVLPMALMLMAAGAFIIMPGLQATGSMLTISRNMENKTKAYYAAEAGIAHSIWQCRKTSSPPVNETLHGINGTDVNVAVLHTQTLTSNSILYTVQSSTSDGLISTAKVIVQIKQTGDQGNNVFDQAVASLNGNISISGGSKVSSDDVFVVDDCDSSWSRVPASSHLSCSTGSSPYVETGKYYDTSKSAKFTINDAATVETLAYYNSGTDNISTYKYLTFWIYSTVALNAGDLAFKIATNTALGGTTETILIPAIAASTGTRVRLDIGNPANFGAMKSIGIAQVVDKGAFTLYIDEVVATNDISDGDIYANGNVNIIPSGQVNGDASAMGTITDSQNRIYGTKTPSASRYETQAIDINSYKTIANIKGGTVYQTLSTAWNASDLGQITVNGDATINWSSYNITMGPAWIGGNLNISTNTITMGPTYVVGNMTVGGASQVTLKGDVYCEGVLTISAGTNVQGPYTLVGKSVVLNGGSSTQLGKGNVPFVIAFNGNIDIGGSAILSAVVYAPNGQAHLSGTGTVYGSVVAKSVVMDGSAVVNYMSGIRTMPFPAGWGLGPGPGAGGGLGGTSMITNFDYE
jgi:Tfp pilus assembly protein PilX